MYVCINIKREVQSHAYTFIDLTKADYDMEEINRPRCVHLLNGCYLEKCFRYFTTYHALNQRCRIIKL